MCIRDRVNNYAENEHRRHGSRREGQLHHDWRNGQHAGEHLPAIAARYDLAMPWQPALFDAVHEVRNAPDLEAQVYTAVARAAGEPVLELGCGTGRVLTAVLEAGIAIDGVEIQQSMADAARHKLRDRGLSARIFTEDARRFEPPGRYRLVIIPSNTLSCFHDHESLNQVFANAARCLCSDGQLAFDVMQISKRPAPRFEAPLRWDGDDAKYVQEISFDASRAMATVFESVTRAGRTVASHETTQRLWRQREIEAAFELAGFSYLSAPVDERGRPPSKDSVLFFARLRRGAPRVTR